MIQDVWRYLIYQIYRIRQYFIQTKYAPMRLRTPAVLDSRWIIDREMIDNVCVG